MAKVSFPKGVVQGLPNAAGYETYGSIHDGTTVDIKIDGYGDKTDELFRLVAASAFSSGGDSERAAAKAIYNA